MPVRLTVQGPLYQALLGLLADRSHRLSEILAAPSLSGTPPTDLMRAVDAGVAMGLFEVSTSAMAIAAPDVRVAPTMPNMFNRTVLAKDALGGRVIALASELAGTGYALGDLDAAILHELLEHGDTGLAERIDARLAGSGRSLQRDGKPIADEAERLQLVRAACQAFCEQSLPQLARLGIVTPA